MTHGHVLFGIITVAVESAMDQRNSI